jgi:hypothetical protein
MKGINLVSVARSQRTDLPFPLEGVNVTTLFLTEPRTELLEVEVLYLALRVSLCIFARVKRSRFWRGPGQS